MYILDTNAVIYYVKEESRVVSIIEDIYTKNVPVSVSVITEAELFGFPQLSDEEAERIEKFLHTVSTLVSGKSGDFPLWKAVGGECDEALPTPMPLDTLGHMPCHRRLFPQWACRYGDLEKIHAQ